MTEQDYVVQITVKGMDDDEREVMWNVRGRTVEEFDANLARYAERINKINGYHFRSKGSGRVQNTTAHA